MKIMTIVFPSFQGYERAFNYIMNIALKGTSNNQDIVKIIKFLFLKYLKIPQIPS